MVVVTFAPDSFQEIVTVPIVDDGTAEPAQRFYGRLALSNAQGVDLSDAATSVNIIDDDGKCAFMCVWLLLCWCCLLWLLLLQL